MRLDKLLAEQIIELIDNATHSFLGAIQDGRVVLGGSAGSAGGTGDPPAGFWGQLRQANVTYDTAGSRPCSAGSAGSDSLVDNLDRIRLGWDICDDAINEDHIDWGLGADQVSAVDVPFQTTSGSIAAINVRDAIEETYAAGGGGVGAHNILSVTHTDTPGAAAVVRGDLFYGDATPDWNRLPIGVAQRILGSDGADPSWVATTDGQTASTVIRTSATSGIQPKRLMVGSAIGIPGTDGEMRCRGSAEATFGAHVDSARTDNVATVAELIHLTSGSATHGFGGRLVWKLEDGGGNQDDGGAVEVIWGDAADGSEDSYIRFLVRVAGAALAEICRIDGDGLRLADDKIIDMDERAAAPANPAANRWRLYPKSDGLYQLDDGGVETPLSGTKAEVLVWIGW